jgi:nicotinamidase/pyrazinamidase
MNKTLVIVDFQNDFLLKNGLLSLYNNNGGADLIAKMNDFINRLPNNLFDKIIITQDTHFHEYYHETEEAKSFPLHCDFGSVG